MRKRPCTKSTVGGKPRLDRRGCDTSRGWAPLPEAGWSCECAETRLSGWGVACEWRQEPHGPRVGVRVSWGLFLWGAEKAALPGATDSHLGSTALLSGGCLVFLAIF